MLVVCSAHRIDVYRDDEQKSVIAGSYYETANSVLAALFSRQYFSGEDEEIADEAKLRTRVVLSNPNGDGWSLRLVNGEWEKYLADVWFHMMMAEEEVSNLY